MLSHATNARRQMKPHRRSPGVRRGGLAPILAASRTNTAGDFVTRPAAAAEDRQPHATLTRFGLQLKIGFAAILVLCAAMLVMTS